LYHQERIRCLSVLLEIVKSSYQDSGHNILVLKVKRSHKDEEVGLEIFNCKLRRFEIRAVRDLHDWWAHLTTEWMEPRTGLGTGPLSFSTLHSCPCTSYE
jgi:hypothetical protein